MEAEIGLGDWTIKAESRLLERAGESLHITPKSMAVLLCLVDADNAPVSRGEIFDAVWPGADISDDTLTGCIFELRKAFGDSAREPNVIETIPKHGFRLIPRAERLPASASTTLTQSPANATNHSFANLRQKLGFIIVCSLAALIGLGAYAYWAFRPMAFSIAVLPFEVIGPTPELQKLAQGLHEEVIDRVTREEFCIGARCANPEVTSRTDAEHAADVYPEITEAAAALGVNYLLEGSVRQQGSQLRITSQLIRSSDGFHIWSKAYERTVSENFNVQTNLASGIANLAVNLMGLDVVSDWVERLSPLAGTRWMVFHPEMLAVFRESLLLQLGEGGSQATVVALVKQAVEAHPDDTLALGWLASTYIQRMHLGIPAAVAARAAHAALDAAEAIDPDAPSTADQRAQVYHNLELDFAVAEAAYQKLSAADPHWLSPVLGQARIAATEGRTADTRRLLELSATLSAGYAETAERQIEVMLWHFLREPERAMRISQALLATQEHGPAHEALFFFQCVSLLALERTEELGIALRSTEIPTGGKLYRAAIYAIAGQSAEARRLFESFEYTAESFRPFALLAIYYQAMGETDQAFQIMREGVAADDVFIMGGLRLSPLWDGLRDDPRFGEMLRLMDSKITYTQYYVPATDTLTPRS